MAEVSSREIKLSMHLTDKQWQLFVV